jgi:hypothetical protein
MSRDLGIRAAVREAIAHGSDHWTIWLERAGLQFPAWYRSNQSACVPPITHDARDALHMAARMRYGKGPWV